MQRVIAGFNDDTFLVIAAMATCTFASNGPKLIILEVSHHKVSTW